MSKKEIVSVSIFGGKSIFGGRETRREVVVSSCPFANSCKALESGRCASNNPRRESCINMSNKTVQGYTSRAKKFNEFMQKWRGHEKYNAVNKGLRRFEYVGNDLIRIKLTHIDIDKALKGENGYRAPGAGKPYYINKSEFNIESLKKIMASYSRPVMGGRLDSKEAKEEMLIAIKSVDRKLYDEYIEETGTVVDYVGKKAYVNTLKPNVELSDGWFFDGEFMHKKERNSVNCHPIWGFAYGTEIKFRPEDDSIIEILNNDWVGENTEFKT